MAVTTVPVVATGKVNIMVVVAVLDVGEMPANAIVSVCVKVCDIA